MSLRFVSSSRRRAAAVWFWVFGRQQLVIPCFVLALLALDGETARATAAPLQGLTVLPSGEPERPEVRYAMTDPGGGYSVFFSDGQVRSFNAAGAAIGSYASLLLETGPHIWRGLDFSSARFSGVSLVGRHVVFRERARIVLLDRRIADGTSAACLNERVAGDRTLTVFRLDRIDPPFILDRRPDSGGGFWMVDSVGNLYRFAADCHKQWIARVGAEPIALSADPERVAVYVHSNDGQLGYFDSSGLRWRRALPSFDEPMQFTPNPVDPLPVPIGSIGGGLHVTPYHSFTLGSRLAAFDRAGSLVWVWTDDEGEGLLDVQTFSVGALLKTGSSVRMIDLAGVERWREHAPEWLRGSISARFDSNHAWLYVDSFDNHEKREIRSYDLALGESGRVAVDLDVVPVAGLAGGTSLALQPVRCFNHCSSPVLLRGDPSGNLRELDFPGMNGSQRIVATADDDAGTIAIGLGATTWTMYGLDLARQLRWHQSHPIETTHGDPRFQLALSEQSVCVLVSHWAQSRETSMLRVHCTDRVGGQSRFEPVEWPGFSAYLRPMIEDEIEVIHGGPLNGDLIRRRIIALDGRVIEIDRSLPRRWRVDQQFLQDVRYTAAGRTVLFTAPFGSAIAVDILPPASRPDAAPVQFQSATDWSALYPTPNHPTFGTAHGQIALLGLAPSDYPWPVRTLWLWAYNEESGRARWFRKVASPVATSISSLLATEQGWLIAQASATELHLSHFNAEDGRVLMQSILPFDEPLVDIWTGSVPQLNFSVGNGRVAVVSPLPNGTRTHWIDDRSGELLATVTSPMRYRDSTPPSRIRSDGNLVISGQAIGISHLAPVLHSIAPPARRSLTEASVAELNGAWFDPVLTGQGWFIDVMAPQRAIFGAWFTYDHSLSGDHTGLRWYTMQGRFPADGGVAELMLYSNAGGVFEAGPVTGAEPVGRVRLWPASTGDLQMEVRFGTESETLRIGQSLTRVLPVTTRPGVRHWFDPAISGQGIVLAQPLETDGPLFGAWFTYDINGDDPSRQHWFTIQGSDDADAGLREAILYRTTGGTLATGATSNTRPVGTILISRLACDRILIDYRFDLADSTDPFFGRAGQRELQAIAGCVTDR